MLKYKLEEKKLYFCEICGTKPAKKKATGAISLKEFYSDGTTKIHYVCSNHIVDLYNRITKKTENQ